ncbi:MAG TPA: hypothetical protein VEL51_02875 [Vicinamibacterales bacterium]|nr:hypothetical protein [Vicinamibacterales bacterium]
MLARIALATLVAIAPLAAQQEERPKVPKDSIMVVITGCIKGRVIRAADVRQTDTTSGYNVRATTFRLAGKKDVMAAVKEQDGQRAEVTGLIKKSSLIEPGVKFKGGRVVIGGGSSAGSMGSMPSPAENVLVLDAVTVTGLGGSCGS